MKRILLLLLLLVPLAAADEFIFNSSLYNAQWVTTQTTISSGVDMYGDSSSLRADLSYVPGSFDHQTVRDVQTTPDAEQTQEGYTWEWQDPPSSVSYEYEAIVQSRFYRPEIKEKIDFPYAYVPPEHAEYLDSYEIIRITDDIERQAEIIVGDEDDAVVAVYEVAEWVKNNIEYDLQTVTAEAAQSSQWVLDNRFGVCDEITSLFIAMLRSQGIPARFVSGVAYTNLPSLGTFWGPHGWAEVWFPEVGWVPYDVTYGQYGFVDATHIFFQVRPDAQTAAVEYTYFSRDGSFEPRALERSTELLESGLPISEDVSVEVETALEHVSFGSFNRIDAMVTNRRDYYVSTELYLTNTAGLKSEDLSRGILLGPGDTRRVQWLVEVDEDLDERYLYTFPIIVHTNTDRAFTAEFEASQDGPQVDEQDAYVPTPETPRSLQAGLQCSYPEHMLLGEERRVVCATSEPARICIEGVCARDQLSYTPSFDAIGVHTLRATATQNGLSQSELITLRVEDEPDVNISVHLAGAINASDIATARIVVTPTSFSNPRDVFVTVQHPLFDQQWDVGEISGRSTFDLQFTGLQMLSGDNTLLVTVTHADGERAIEKIVHVEPRGVSEHILLWLNDFYAWIGSF